LVVAHYDLCQPKNLYVVIVIPDVVCRSGGGCDCSVVAVSVDLKSKNKTTHMTKNYLNFVKLSSIRHVLDM